MNYLISLLDGQDRSVLISELHEMQTAISDTPTMRRLHGKKDDFESRTLKEVRDQLGDQSVQFKSQS